MPELKTKKTDLSVDAFLGAITDERKRGDAKTIAAMMKHATKAAPKMWGRAIVGFGDRTLKYPSGRELEWFSIGFSPRKQALTLYLGDFSGRAALLQKLGKHTTGKGCIYIKALEDVDAGVLKKMLAAAAGKP
ncbi:MAG TPA: DUF1801 domain-containing protein [Polyangiaceae bacterium]|jgi:hypothetical protein